MKVLESAENYLETIFMLNMTNKPTRSIDIANELNFSRPSVSVAMKNLKTANHISIDENGHITLTESGLKIAQSMYERHMLISNWLITLGVDEKTATKDACRIEHAMSEQSFNAIKKHLEGDKK